MWHKLYFEKRLLVAVTFVFFFSLSFTQVPSLAYAPIHMLIDVEATKDASPHELLAHEFAWSQAKPRDVLVWLDNISDVNVRGINDCTALIQAAEYNDNPDIVALLIDAGAKIEAQDNYGNTALHHAISSKNNEAAKRLLELGADVDVQDDSGETVLMTALTSDNIDMVVALLGVGVKIDVRDDNDLSALDYAVAYGDISAVKAFIEAGADVNAQDSEKTTALMLAVRVNEPNIIITLLDAGADAGLRDAYGKTALDYANEEGYLEGTVAYKKLLKSIR